ncbi:MAG TPA: hypothetical protein VF719_09615, partial [Abditibacteriaceae bacterium]
MKTRLGREILLLCAPVALFLGGLAGWSAWQTRWRTPRVALSVKLQKPEPLHKLGIPYHPDETLRFGWIAILKGGPKSGYRFGWNEQIVAVSRLNKRTVVSNLSAPPPGWTTSAKSSFYSFGGAQVSSASASGPYRGVLACRLGFNLATLPLDTKKLEWKGEMVTIPFDTGPIWQEPMTPAALQEWRQLPGAAS